MEVSARLRDEPEVERNLNGYLITAFHHRVRSQLLRDSRLAYEVSFTISRKTISPERRIGLPTQRLAANGVGPPNAGPLQP